VARRARTVRNYGNSSISDEYLIRQYAENISLEPRREPAPALFSGIFLLSAAVLLFELSLTRIFSVMLWSNLAFMVVSTALFGFGLSGVALALRPELPGAALADGTPRRSALFCLLMSLSTLVSYAVISTVPFKMWAFQSHPENYLYLAIWEVALLLPFFFAGLTIAGIMSSFPQRAGKLYGVDLLGAALGSLALIFVITAVGGVGTMFLAASLGAAAALCFSRPAQGRLKAASIISCLLLLVLSPFAEHLFPLQFHQRKRHFGEDTESEPILATRWSSLSRVDIAEETTKNGPLRGHDMRAVWIDGGTNESVMLKMEGQNIDELPPQNWTNIAAPYALKDGTSPNVLIIGSSGGREVLFALSHGAQHVDALEMDPSIVHFVNQPENAKYMGYVYQNKRVHLINDEGRAFLRRMPKGSYDIIQSVNNYTPVAMAAGALNLSETFLITTEAFHDYLAHLTPNGVVSLHRGAVIRVALTAMQALREEGIEHPENYIVLANGPYDANQCFFLKKSPWTREEVQKLHETLSSLRHFGGSVFLWTPFKEYRQDPYYTHIMSASAAGQEFYAHGLGLNLAPTTDDKPFIEHFTLFGPQKLVPGTPPEFKKREREKWMDIVPRGDFPYVAILAESAALAFLFVGVPLALWARGTAATKGFWGFIGFFAALGFGFIVVEICLMKRYVLFLGHPAYSITTILVALLCGAGVGSLLTETLGRQHPRRVLVAAMIGVAAMLLGEMWISPHIFSHFLSLPLIGRLLITTAMLFPLGMCMGMPFTLGISLIHRQYADDVTRRKMIAWAWGINGYTTVIGSALTVFLALYFGFNYALLLAAAVYLAGLAAVLFGTRGLLSA
jgi:hypothetical protein